MRYTQKDTKHKRADRVHTILLMNTLTGLTGTYMIIHKYAYLYCNVVFKVHKSSHT